MLQQSVLSFKSESMFRVSIVIIRSLIGELAHYCHFSFNLIAFIRFLFHFYIILPFL